MTLLARFAAVVASQGLELEHAWRGAGRIDGVPVRLTLEQDDARACTVLDVDFDPPLGPLPDATLAGAGS